jgi:copper chaperone CopZ
MPEVRLSVNAMRCRHCVREVTSWLRDVPGVETVVADAAANTVLLGGTMTVADVLAVFNGTEYAPRVLHSSGPAAAR